MSVIGRRTTKDGRKLFLIWNSWGNNWANGPYWQDMPEGSFFIEWKVMDSMLAKGDSFAYGGLEGFKKRGLDDLGTKEYLGMLKIGGSDEQITPCLLCFGGRVSDCPHCGAGYAHERRNKDSKPSIDKLLDVSRTLADHATRSGHGTQRAGVRVPVGPGSDNAKHGPVHSSP